MRRNRATMPLLGAFLLSFLGIFLVASSRQIGLETKRITANTWRTTYDILVRPKANYWPSERQLGLVPANYLAGTYGGITIAQWRTIASLPEVEIAAPIAPLGVVGNGVIFTQPLPARREGALFLLQGEDIANSGAGKERWTMNILVQQASQPQPQDLNPQTFNLGWNGFWQASPQRGVMVDLRLPLTIAGIDPEAESRLVGLDKTVVSGKPFQNAPIRHEKSPSGGQSAIIPVWLNQTPYIHYTPRAALYAFPEDASKEEILALPPEQALARFAPSLLWQRSWDTETVYNQIVGSLFVAFGGKWPGHTFEGIPTVTGWGEVAQPQPMLYTAEGKTAADAMPHLRLQRPSGQAASVFPRFRQIHRETTRPFSLYAMGVIDIRRLPRPSDVNRVPLETYYPPSALLVADAQGRPVNPPRPLYPTLNPAGYLQPPPLALTTVDAVCTVLGREDCISAVRVRVAGIEAMSPAAQAKIEAVAGEIHRRTGLEVDIMVGSSPTPVLVDVPDVGTVQEFWIRKGVTTAYQERINLGQWLFLALLAVVAGLYTVHQGWLMLAREQQALALRKALGWRTGWVVRQTVGSYLLAVAAGAAVGALTAWGAALAAGHAPLPWWAYAVVPVGMLAAFGLGATPAALSVVRMAPVAVLRMGGLRGEREQKGRGGVGSLWGYTLTGWRRRPRRALAVLLANALAGGLVVLLAAILVDRQAYLRTTLLGQYILLHLGPEHGLMVGLTLLLAGLLTGNDLSAEVASRRGEFGLLRALGWREGAVRGVVLREGWLSGVLGGLLGGLLGWGAFWAMYAASPRGLGWLLAAGVALPGLVGVVAAWLPARRAARIPPAQVLRGE